MDYHITLIPFPTQYNPENVIQHFIVRRLSPSKPVTPLRRQTDAVAIFVFIAQFDAGVGGRYGHGSTSSEFSDSLVGRRPKMHSHLALRLGSPHLASCLAQLKNTCGVAVG